MRSSLLAISVIGTFATPHAATAAGKPPKPPPEYKVQYVEGSYQLLDATCQTSICWDVTSPTSQAISHFVMAFGTCAPAGATLTSGNGARLTFTRSQLTSMTSANHPPCDVAGIKFDYGFADGETKRLCMTYDGMLPLSEAPNTGFFIKAGTACVPEIGARGVVCDGHALCADNECGGGQWTCPGGGGAAVCAGSMEPNECGGCEALPGEVGGRCTPTGASPSNQCVHGTWDCDGLNALTCVEHYDDCAEFDDCRDFVCEPSTGACVLHQVYDERCQADNDDDRCNGAGERCDENKGCVPIPPVTCDTSFCHGATCDKADGQCHPNPTCDPGEFCQEDERACWECETDEHCASFDTDCSTYTCRDGACVLAEADDGYCQNGSVCDGLELCDPRSGCYEGSPLVCPTSDACTSYSCDDVTGCGSRTTTCDDASKCTSDTCDPKLGCVFSRVSCDDDNACTVDGCEASSGCTTTPKHCDDGDACTTDSCDPGSGCKTAPVVCADNDPCTDDSCDPATGCKSVDRCDDDEVCDGGNCVDCLSDTDCPTGKHCSSAHACVACTSPTHCSDAETCSTDTCVGGICQHDYTGCSQCAAGTVIGFGDAAIFNAMTCGDFVLGADTQGPAGVGGDATFTGFGINTNTACNAASGLALAVVGGMATNGEIRGNATAGPDFVKGSGVNVCGTFSRDPNLEAWFATQCGKLSMTSAKLLALAPNGTAANQNGTLQLTGTNTTLNIFAVAATMLPSGNNGVVINVPSGSKVLVNVTGTEAWVKSYTSLSGTTRENVLFNLDLAVLHLANISFQGSILAPKTDIYFANGNIEGQTFANNIYAPSGAQWHKYYFAGLTCPQPTPPTTGGGTTGGGTASCGGATVTQTVLDWGGSYQITFNIKNGATAAAAGWRLAFDVSPAVNAVNNVYAEPWRQLSWTLGASVAIKSPNGGLAANEGLKIYLQANKPAGSAVPTLSNVRIVCGP